MGNDDIVAPTGEPDFVQSLQGFASMCESSGRTGGMSPEDCDMVAGKLRDACFLIDTLQKLRDGKIALGWQLVPAAPSPASPEKGTERMREALRWAHDTLMEINTSNYTHDEVCALNAASVEVILGIAPLLGKMHGKTPEWWAEYQKANPIPPKEQTMAEDTFERNLSPEFIKLWNSREWLTRPTSDKEKAAKWYAAGLLAGRASLPAEPEGEKDSLRSIEDGLIQSILDASPEDTIAELREQGIDPDASVKLVDEMAAAVTAARSTRPTAPKPAEVRVKGLEWSWEPPYSVVRAMGGHYAVERWEDDAGSPHFDLIGPFVTKRDGFSSADDAKAAAQADYERRILSALEPFPAPAAGVRRAGWILMNDGGKRWRICGPSGRWVMKPEGAITADEARVICEAAMDATALSPTPAAEEFRRGAEVMRERAAQKAEEEGAFRDVVRAIRALPLSGEG